MANNKEELSFKSKQAAHAYRVKHMLPLVINKNQDLFNTTYFFCRGVSRVAQEDNNTFFTNYLRDINSFELTHNSYRDSFSKYADFFDLAPYELLASVDNKLSETLKTLNIEVNLPSAEDSTELIFDSKPDSNIAYFETNMKMVALELLQGSKSVLDEYENKFLNSYSSNTTIKERSNGSAGDSNWQSIAVAFKRYEEIGLELEEMEEYIGYINDGLNMESYYFPMRAHDLFYQKPGKEIEYFKKIGLYEPFKALVDSSCDIEIDEYYSKLHSILQTYKDNEMKRASLLVTERETLCVEQPMLDVVKTTEEKGEVATDGQIYKYGLSAIDTARKAQLEVEEKIISGKVNLCKLDIVVNLTKEKLGIVKPDTLFNSTILHYIEMKKKDSWALSVLGIALGIGAFICMLSGVGSGLGVVIGLAGAALGAPDVVAMNQLANFNAKVLDASIGEGNDLTTMTQAQVDNSIITARVGIALLALDVAVSGVEFVKIGRLTSKLGSHTFKYVSKFLSGSDMLKVASWSDDTASIFGMLLKNSAKPKQITKGLLETLPNLPKTQRTMKVWNTIDDIQGATQAVLKGGDLRDFYNINKVAQIIPEVSTDRLTEIWYSSNKEYFSKSLIINYIEGNGNIDNLITLANKGTTCTHDELFKYLSQYDAWKKTTNYADDFIKNGVWPDEAQVPKNSNVLNSKGKIDWKQVPKNGFVLNKGKAIKGDYVPRINEIIDRYGPSDGRFTSPVIDGNPYSYDMRSLPYIEDMSKYHQYEVIGDFNNIEKYYDKCTDLDLKLDMLDYMAEYDLTFNNMKVQKGNIAKGFDSSGGGIQYQLPLPVDMLIGLKILKEIN